MALDKSFSRTGLVAGGGALAAILVVGVVLYAVSNKKAAGGDSNVALGSPAQVAQADPSPKYTQILNQHNTDEAGRAVKAGDSYVPVFTAPAAPQPQTPPASHQASAPVPQYAQAGTAGPLPPGLQQQVDALRRAWEPPGNAVIVGVQSHEQGVAAKPASVAPKSAQRDAAPAAKRSLLGRTPAVPAVLNSSIKTDEPSMVMATITSGLMVGGVLHGEAKRAGEVVNVKFNTLYLGGRHISVNAVAIDEDSMRSALTGDVDHKYMARIGIPVLLGLMGGYAAAKATASTVSVMSPLGGVTQATGNLSDSQIESAGVAAGVQAATKVFQQNGDQSRDISVTIPQGQSIGVWFLADVVEP